MKRKLIVVLKEIHLQKYEIELKDDESIKDGTERVINGEGEISGCSEFFRTIEGKDGLHVAYIAGMED